MKPISPTVVDLSHLFSCITNVRLPTSLCCPHIFVFFFHLIKTNTRILKGFRNVSFASKDALPVLVFLFSVFCFVAIKSEGFPFSRRLTLPSLSAPPWLPVLAS